MKNKKRFSESNCVSVVGCGAIATELAGDGRVIPVAILDCSNHNKLRNLISNHPELPGDCISTWGVKSKWFTPNSVYLMLEFTRPADLEVVIKFNLIKYPMLADGIIKARSVYLQTNELGNRLNSEEAVNVEKILVEVPASTMLPNWDDILLKQLTKKIKKEGHNYKVAKSMASEHLSKNREFWGKGMKAKKSDYFEINTTLSRL